MHHDTCVTHVSWCMSGSLICGGGENVPGIPGACATHNFTYLARGPCYLMKKGLRSWVIKPWRINIFLQKYPAVNDKWTSEIEGNVNDLCGVNGLSVKFQTFIHRKQQAICARNWSALRPYHPLQLYFWDIFFRQEWNIWRESDL